MDERVGLAIDASCAIAFCEFHIVRVNKHAPDHVHFFPKSLVLFLEYFSYFHQTVTTNNQIFKSTEKLTLA